MLQVNHPEFGTLFAAMIQGEGELISETDDSGFFIPFMTTDEILKQLEKFGFYIQYDVKTALPDRTFTFLQQISLLGYDKITKVLLQTQSKEGDTIWQPTVLVFKSVEENQDLYSYGTKLTRIKYMKKVTDNVVLNVTKEEGIKWDWVTSYFNIADILEENLDGDCEPIPVVDPSYNNSDMEPYSPINTSVPEGYTLYSEEDDNGAAE